MASEMVAPKRVEAGGRVFVLEERRPVWSALSDLFLDTDVALFRERIAEQLAASPYSLSELQEILVDEVYPVCRGNLFTWPGGEWAGFDEVWLEKKILRRLCSPLRTLHWINLGRLSLYASWNWRRIRKRVADLRSGGPNARATGTQADS